mmetsp:Transcript_61914/g.110327  ORF Transcript_61914/g.110327 Transcript_61914/m.110327 type:complete len:124 (+) Transcript_61914:200-571(+)
MLHAPCFFWLPGHLLFVGPVVAALNQEPGPGREADNRCVQSVPSSPPEEERGTRYTGYSSCGERVNTKNAVYILASHARMRGGGALFSQAAADDAAAQEGAVHHLTARLIASRMRVRAKSRLG